MDHTVCVMQLFDAKVEAAATHETVPCLVQPCYGGEFGAWDAGDGMKERSIDDGAENPRQDRSE